jgi:two-component system sensor kinase FixL
MSTQEAYFETLMNAAVDAIIVIDQNGRIEIFNKAAEEVFGYVASEILGENVSRLMPEPDRSAHDQYLNNYHTSRNPKIIGIGREVVGLHKNGMKFSVLLSVGEVTGTETPRFIGIIRDLREHQRLEREVREMQSELVHATRLSELGEMTAGIAHEINQPLTAISTYANACHRMLANEQIDATELLNTLHLITDQAQRAGEVVRRLRTFTKKRLGQRQLLEINTIIDATIRLVEADIRARNFNLRKSLTPALPKVFADNIQIQQVVLNLIRNAMDAMESVPSRENIITIETKLGEDNCVRVSVSDQGIGLTEDIAEKIFDSFFTTKVTGTGIGLSISRSIITAHGGILNYSPNQEDGVTFYFTLPAAIENKNDDS